MAEEFDLVVIGAGPGGYVAAIRAAQLGLKTACVEMESRLGGTCLRVGCVPSKALLESSERFHEAQSSFEGMGIKVAGLELDLDVMLERKDRIVNELTRGVDGLFKKNKVTRVLGRGRITGPGQVVVEAEGGDGDKFHNKLQNFSNGCKDLERDRRIERIAPAGIVCSGRWKDEANHNR